MAEATKTAGADLHDYLNILRRRKWAIIVVTLLTVAATLGLSYSQTPLYTSGARVLVRPTEIGDETQESVNLETERALVDSSAIATIVADTLGTDRSPSDLLDGISVSVEGTTEILNIQYNADSPGEAQDLANGFASGYLEFRREQARIQSQREIGRVEDKIAAAQNSIAEIARDIQATDNPTTKSQLLAQRDSLVARLGVLEFNLDKLTSALGSLDQVGGQVVEPANLPSQPSSPNHIQDALLALIIGLVLGTGLAFLLERLDDRPRGRADFEAQIGAPILAVIPRNPGRQKRKEAPPLLSIADPNSPTAEAYRTLRTAIQFSAARGSIRVLTVTSPGPGEGKSATVSNLAVALATVGKRVIAVSGDMRRPSLHRFFGLSNDVGLADVLAGTVSLDAAVQEATVPGVSILAGGAVPATPVELLDSTQMQRLVRTLRSKWDFVLLDGPPVLAMADALILCPYGDGVLMVADASKTTKAALEHAKEQIEQVGGKIIGGLVNRFDGTRGSYYSPYYGTPYYRYSSSEEKGRLRADGNGAKPERVGRKG